MAGKCSGEFKDEVVRLAEELVGPEGAHCGLRRKRSASSVAS